MTEAQDRLLSVVIPLWNEEKVLHWTVDALRAALERHVRSGHFGSWELVLVDDASTDATGTMLDALAEADPRIVVVHHERNRTLGGSVRTGLATARGDLILYTDADLPFDPDEIGRAVHLLDLYEADVVSAYRHDRKGEGVARYVYSYCYNALANALFGLRVRDVNFAAKLVRRWVVDAVDLHSEGSFVDVELLVRARAAGAKVIQFGVDYFPRTRGTSTLSSPAVIGRILRELGDQAPELRALSRR